MSGTKQTPVEKNADGPIDLSGYEGPTDKFLRRLKLGYYMTEAAHAVGGPVAAVGAMEMFAAVWNHDLPRAVVAGTIALAGRASRSAGRDGLFNSIRMLGQASYDLGTEVSPRIKLTKTQVRQIYPDGVPTTSIMSTLVRAVHQQAGTVGTTTMIGGIGTEAFLHAGSPVAATVFGSLLAISTVIDHRKARRGINDLMEVGVNTGLVDGAVDKPSPGHGGIGPQPKPGLVVRRTVTFTFQP